MLVAISDGDFGGKGGRSEARRHLEGLESEGKHRAARVFARGLISESGHLGLSGLNVLSGRGRVNPPILN